MENVFIIYYHYFAVFLFCHQPEDIWWHKDRNHSVYYYVLDLPCIWVSVVESQILAPGTLYVHA